MENLEKRFTPSVGESKGFISGYAILWNKSAKVGGFSEEFATDSLKECDKGVSLYHQHDPKRILGNTKAGTLKLYRDDLGLRYEAQLPQSANDVKESVARRDVRGVSVGFRCQKDSYSGNKRKIENAKLIELSLTDRPAHETSIQMRSENTPKNKHWRNLLWSYQE